MKIHQLTQYGLIKMQSVCTVIHLGHMNWKYCCIVYRQMNNSVKMVPLPENNMLLYALLVSTLLLWIIGKAIILWKVFNRSLAFPR